MWRHWKSWRFETRELGRIVPFDGSWLPLAGNSDHHPPKNEQFSQNVHLKMLLSGQGWKMSNSKPGCRVSADIELIQISACFQASYSWVNSCFTAGKRIRVWNCPATCVLLQTTIFTSIVYGEDQNSFHTSNFKSFKVSSNPRQIGGIDSYNLEAVLTIVHFFVLSLCTCSNGRYRAVRWSNFDRQNPNMRVFLRSTEATPCGHLLKWKLTPKNPTAETMFMAAVALVLPWKIVEDLQSFVKNTKLWPSL